jgi:Tfp pilus assembly protein PilO
MSRHGSLWWQQRALWLPPALLLVVGLGALVFYQAAVVGRLGLEAGAVSARQAELAELTGRRREAEALLARARTARAGLEAVYRDRLGSEESRLTAVMLQVKQLARQAGLSGLEAISYTDQEVDGLPLAEKVIQFTAEGSYEQLRSFINLLEVAESFLALSEIRVQDTAGTGRLQVAVVLSTLFVEEHSDERGERPAEPTGARTGGGRPRA